MLHEMSIIEWNEWLVYMGLEPFGEWRDDVRAASICTTLANVWRDAEAHPEPFTIGDFRVQFGDALEAAKVDRKPIEPAQTPKDIERHLTDWIMWNNARYKEASHA